MNNQKIEDEIKKIEQASEEISEKFVSVRNSTFSKFPILFVLLTTFGVVATFYGFEEVINSIPLFSDNPLLILITGIAVLSLTGALYKKLS